MCFAACLRHQKVMIIYLEELWEWSPIRSVKIYLCIIPVLNSMDDCKAWQTLLFTNQADISMVGSSITSKYDTSLHGISVKYQIRFFHMLNSFFKKQQRGGTLKHLLSGSLKKNIKLQSRILCADIFQRFLLYVQCINVLCIGLYMTLSICHSPKYCREKSDSKFYATWLSNVLTLKVAWK